MIIQTELSQKIKKHSQLCSELEEKGYTIQGCGDSFDRCYFSEGNRPDEKLIGYINLRTLEVIYYKPDEVRPLSDIRFKI